MQTNSSHNPAADLIKSPVNSLIDIGANLTHESFDDDLDEVMLMSDRIAVMYEGRIMGMFDAADADRERIGLMMGGHDAAEDATQ